MNCEICNKTMAGEHPDITLVITNEQNEPKKAYKICFECLKDWKEFANNKSTTEAAERQ